MITLRWFALPTLLALAAPALALDDGDDDWGDDADDAEDALEAGLVAYWPLDGDAEDESENELDGSMCGPRAVEGHRGPGSVALEFDGVDDYVDLGSALSTVHGLTQGSISLWFRVDQAPDQFPNRALNIPQPTQLTFPALYMGKIDTVNGNSSLMVHPIHPNSRPTAWYTIVRNMRSQADSPFFCFDTCFFPPPRTNNAAQCNGPGNDVLTAGEWYHFVVTVDASGNHGYLNGEELLNRRFNPNRERPQFLNTPAGPGAPSEATDTEFFDDVIDPSTFRLGAGAWAYASFLRYFDGAIDEVRIYDRALTGAEVTSLYTEPWAEFEELEEEDHDDQCEALDDEDDHHEDDEWDPDEDYTSWWE